MFSKCNHHCYTTHGDTAGREVGYAHIRQREAWSCDSSEKSRRGEEREEETRGGNEPHPECGHWHVEDT